MSVISKNRYLEPIYFDQEGKIEINWLYFCNMGQGIQEWMK